nr:hypothetical protein [Pyrinomonadaceae bacterium]
RRPSKNNLSYQHTPEIIRGVCFLLGENFDRLKYAAKIERAHELILADTDSELVVITLVNEFAVCRKIAARIIQYATAIHRAVYFNSLVHKSKLHIARKLSIVDKLISEGKDLEAVDILDKIALNGGFNVNLARIHKNETAQAIGALTTQMLKKAPIGL